MTIRRATASDAAAMHHIENCCFDDPWSESLYLETLCVDNAFYFVGETEGKIIALAGFHQVLDEGHISNVAVLPDYRGRGCGKALVEHLIRDGEKIGISAFTLEVRISNFTAIALYQSMDFVAVGVRPHYYDNGEDAFIMWRKRT